MKLWCFFLAVTFYDLYTFVLIYNCHTIFIYPALEVVDNNSRIGVAILFTGLSLLMYFYANWFYYMREVSKGVKLRFIEIIIYPAAPQVAFLIPLGAIGKEILIFYLALLFIGHGLLKEYRYKLWDIRFRIQGVRVLDFPICI